MKTDTPEVASLTVPPHGAIRFVENPALPDDMIAAYDARRDVMIVGKQTADGWGVFEIPQWRVKAQLALARLDDAGQKETP